MSGIMETFMETVFLHGQIVPRLRLSHQEHPVAFTQSGRLASIPHFRYHSGP